MGNAGGSAAKGISVLMTTAVGVILTGEIKPYVRMTRRGKWVKPDAIAYQASQDALKYQIREQLQEKGHRTDDFPIFKNQQPLRAMLTICVSRNLHAKDLDNQIKAILDAAQGLIFENDLWVDSISAERSLGSENLTELVLVAATSNSKPQNGVEKR